MTTPDDPCARLAPYLDDPAAYVAARKALDLEEVGRRAGSDEPVTVTARSLFLTRDVTVQVSREPVYVASESRFREPDWHVDTFLGGLGLSAEMVRRWAEEGLTVLDVASGLGLFATEAAALGIRVDCVDAEFTDDHPMFAVARRSVPRSYVDQMELLWCLARRAAAAPVGGGPRSRYRMEGPELELLERLLAARHETAARYPAPSGRRFREDATRLGSLADDTYDVVVSGWLLVHLSEEDERRTVESAARVTRGGGEIRLRAGTGGNLARRFRGWFPGGEVAGKRVAVAEGSQEDLLVLRVGA